MLPKFVQRVAPGGQVPTQLPADLTSWVTAPAAAVASRAHEIPHAAERAVEKIPGRRMLWPILALIALLLLAVWLWNRRAAVTNTAFNATDEIRMATERADSALGSLRPGFTAQDLVSALNMGAINFATGSSQIPQESFDYLNRAATAIKAAPTGTVIEVGGHTDNSGDSSANLQLSQARAEAVRNYLISQGVDPTALTAQGYGDSRPLASNDTEEGRFRNRRIQFTVLH
jgi:outer membrane protein OmpA-like peptidoglycan-associated protein